jgi:hypothetical protein
MVLLRIALSGQQGGISRRIDEVRHRVTFANHSLGQLGAIHQDAAVPIERTVGGAAPLL